MKGEKVITASCVKCDNVNDSPWTMNNEVSTGDKIEYFPCSECGEKIHEVKEVHSRWEVTGVDVNGKSFSALSLFSAKNAKDAMEQFRNNSSIDGIAYTVSGVSESNKGIVEHFKI